MKRLPSRLQHTSATALTRHSAGSRLANQPADNEGFREAAHVGHLLRAIARRWKVFLAVFLGFIAVVAIATLLTPKTYTATVRMLVGGTPAVQNAGQNTSLPVLNALLLASGDQTTETYAALLEQEGLAAQVASDLSLNISPGSLLSRVTVHPIVNTMILQLGASWHDSHTAAKIANDFATVFVARQRDLVRSQASAALAFLKAELPSAERRKEDAATALAAYQSKHAIIDINTQTQSILARKGAIESKMDAVQLDAREAAALLANSNQQLARMPATIDSSRSNAANPALMQLEQQLADVNVKLAAARARYTDQHPEVQALLQQRDALTRQIKALPSSVNGGVTVGPNPIYQSLQQEAAQYRARIAGDSAQLRELQVQAAAYAPIIAALPKQTNEIATLQQRAKMAADVLAALEQKYNEALVAQTSAISDVTVVQAASPESASVSPNLVVNVLIATILGLVLATTVVVLMGYFERTMRNEDDVARVVGLPVIGEIPQLENNGRAAIPWLRSMTLEAFLHLCTALRLGAKDAPRTLAVTSPTKGDGKSTIAFYLANVLAGVQPKILLIDADLRRPTLHTRINDSNDVGLGEILRGTCTLQEAVRSVSSGLDAVTSGSFTDNPFTLLQSERFEGMLAEALNSYSTVIVDCTALVPITDALIVSGKVDATALVISANLTDERAAREAVGRMEALGIRNVMGVVLNRVQSHWADYSDYFMPPPAGTLPKSTV
ncbi:MAG: polysaccharide biosynthesis tyrosine autokinase [bacterium]|nr:polysaccharide biosynthesis tyrosine autokinase [bacterium]